MPDLGVLTEMAIVGPDGGRSGSAQLGEREKSGVCAWYSNLLEGCPTLILVLPTWGANGELIHFGCLAASENKGEHCGFLLQEYAVLQKDTRGSKRSSS